MARTGRKVVDAQLLAEPSRSRYVILNGWNARDNTDIELFNRGYVTISVLDGDWEAGEPMLDAITRLSLIDQE